MSILICVDNLRIHNNTGYYYNGSFKFQTKQTIKSLLFDLKCYK